MQDRPYALRVAAVVYGLLVPVTLFAPAYLFASWLASSCPNERPLPSPNCRAPDEATCIGYAIEGCGALEIMIWIIVAVAVLLVSLYLWAVVQFWRGRGRSLRAAHARATLAVGAQIVIAILILAFPSRGIPTWLVMYTGLLVLSMVTLWTPHVRRFVGQQADSP